LITKALASRSRNHPLQAPYQVSVDDGQLVRRTAATVITGDVKDPKFFAALFENDDSAAPDMTPDELKQARRYVIHGEGTVPRERRDVAR
jgi:hypothetical protein